MMKSDKLVVCEELSVEAAESQNILIKGDNKKILPELIKEYGGKVKCIYIDPPYNNGDSYVYYNDKIREEDWLRDIRMTLNYLKLLLTKDGSIWISIDDREMAYLKIEADRVFGRSNYVTTIVWQQRKSRENRAVFSCNHEYILVYARDLKSFKKIRKLLPVSDDFVRARYKNPDNDPRGPWQSVTASVQAGHGVASQFYTIEAPTGIRHEPPKGRCWVYNEERMKREIAAGNIWFGSEGNGAPRIKKFLSSAKIGLTPSTLWVGDMYGTTDSAKKHLLNLFPQKKNVFDTPKPEELIKSIMEISTDEDDIVLDCYLGSGTTITAAHKMNRHYIGIERGEQMTELVLKRLKKVIAGESGGISESVAWKGGGNFAFFRFSDQAKDIIPRKLETEKDSVRPKTSGKARQLPIWDTSESHTEYAQFDMAVSDTDSQYHK